MNQSTLTPEKLESLAAVSRDRARLIDLSATIHDNRLAVVDFVLYSYYQRVRARYQEELNRFPTLPSNRPEKVQVTPPASRDRARLFVDIGSVWTRSSMLMSDMLTARGATYVHVLQPNQYYSARRFSKNEAKTALTDRSPYKQSVEQGYPVLQETARPVFHGTTIRFFDATAVLDPEPAPVYLDDCCHYTVTRRGVLAEFIADAILRMPGSWNN